MSVLYLSFASLVLLGTTLLAISGVVAARSSARAVRVYLALFLGATGLEALMQGGAGFLRSLGSVAWDSSADMLVYWSQVPNLFTPPLLILFAAGTAGHQPPRWTVALLLAGSGVLAAGWILDPPPSTWAAMWSWRWYNIALIGSMGLAAVAVLGRAYRRARGNLDRDRLGAILALCSLLVLPRTALLWVDANLEAAGPVTTDRIALACAATLSLLTLVGASLLLAGLTLARQRHARTVLMRIGMLQAIPLAVWIAFLVDDLRIGLWPLFYSARWFVFVPLLAFDIRRFGLLDLDDRAGRILRPLTLGLAFGFLVVYVAAALAQATSSSLGTSVSFAALAVAAVAGLLAVADRIIPGPARRVAWERESVYRAHLEIGTSKAELEILRRRLGLSRADCAALRRMQAIAAESPAAPGLAAGAVLRGRYYIEAEIGIGAFGRSFIGTDSKTGARVVLKEMLAHWQADRTIASRFRVQVHAAMRAHHSNVVPFLDLMAVEAGHILVLAHIDGRTLRQRFGSGRLTSKEAARIAIDVQAGLEHLHGLGVTHGDVRPENIVVRPDGQAVLLDFGAALAMPEPAAPPSLASFGTASYRSPARRRGGPPCPEDDVYALAAVLWEAMAGTRHPRGRVPAEWRDILQAILEGDARFTGIIRPSSLPRTRARSTSSV